MEGYFTFQWGGLFFRWGVSFLSGEGAPWGGASVLMGGFRKKSLDGGGARPLCPPITMEIPGSVSCISR